MFFSVFKVGNGMVFTVFFTTTDDARFDQAGIRTRGHIPRTDKSVCCRLRPLGNLYTIYTEILASFRSIIILLVRDDNLLIA